MQTLDVEFVLLTTRGDPPTTVIWQLDVRERRGGFAHLGDADGALSDKELALETQSDDTVTCGCSRLRIACMEMVTMALATMSTGDISNSLFESR